MEKTQIETLRRSIEEHLEASDTGALRERIESLHASDLATVVQGLNPVHQQAFFAGIPAVSAAEVLAEVEEHSLRHVAGDLGDESLVPLLAEMTPAAAIEVLEHVPRERRSRLVDALPEELRPDVARRLAYPEDSAGRIMSVRVPVVVADGTVADAVEALRERFAPRDAVETVFAVQDGGRLLGSLSPFRLLLASPDESVAELVERGLPSIPAEMDQEEAADLAVRYDLAALPVTDEQGRLLGAVRFHEVFDVIEEEDGEDLAYAAGTGSDAPTEHTAARAIRARLPWLVVGLVGGVGSAAVLRFFEGALEQAVSLAFFVPVVLGLAGGAAIQSSSLTVRGLGTGSIGLRRLPAVAWRELRVSLGMGLALGLLLGVSAFLLTGQEPAVALSLFLVLVLVLITAAIGGTLIPLALEKAGIDPALAMGPFVTTLSDVVALSIYLSVASALIG